MTDGSSPPPLGTYFLGGIIALMTLLIPISAVILESDTFTNCEDCVKINKPVMKLNT